jgi:phosphoadenosine phosphosulfate reductase
MNIEELNKTFSKKSPEEVLSYFLNEYQGKIVFSTSFGAEDQVLTHIISSITSNAEIFTLDTGRMFPETYETLARTTKKYHIPINIFFPEHKQVEEMVNSKGINLFYESIENRKLCCKVRKTEPLKRALHGKEIWITGLRQEQSITRFNTSLLEWDAENNIVKLNPLYAWTEAMVWDFIKKNDIPYNPLHDQGFPSIGCQPCTRAIKPGDDARSGRWWWEAPEHKECGLHVGKK